jgi:hypothetical protein
MAPSPQPDIDKIPRDFPEENSPWMEVQTSSEKEKNVHHSTASNKKVAENELD